MKYFLDTEFLEGPQQKRLLGFTVGKTLPTIDLISIGIVSETGEEYYAISKDFNLWEAWNRYDIKTEQVYGDIRNIFPEGKKTKVYWIRENVLYPIFYELFLKHNQIKKEEDHIYGNLNNFSGYMERPENKKYAFKKFKSLVLQYGKTNEDIAEEIHDFCINYDPKISVLKNNPEFYTYYGDYDWVVFCWLFGRMIDLPKGFPMYSKDLKQALDEVADWYTMKNLVSPIVSSDWYPNYCVDELKRHPNYPQQTNNHNALSDAHWNLQLYKFLKSIIMSNENFEEKNNEVLKEVQDSLKTNHQTSEGVISGEKTAAEPEPLSPLEKVINERNELSGNVTRLRNFIENNEIFKTLSDDHKKLQKRQLMVMELYQGILGQRIKLFKGGSINQTKGETVIGNFGTDREDVFNLKYLSILMIDATNQYGQSGRRNAIVATQMENTQMMAVKSIFAKD